MDEVVVNDAAEHVDPVVEEEQNGVDAGTDVLAARLEEVEAALVRAREELAASERGRAIEAALVEARAVDIETARVMTEALMAGDTDLDAPGAVKALRGRKAFLFRDVRTGVMGARSRDGAVKTKREVVKAAKGGDRRALLSYLRTRRVG